MCVYLIFLRYSYYCNFLKYTMQHPHYTSLFTASCFGFLNRLYIIYTISEICSYHTHAYTLLGGKIVKIMFWSRIRATNCIFQCQKNSRLCLIWPNVTIWWIRPLIVKTDFQECFPSLCKAICTDGWLNVLPAIPDPKSHKI